MQASKDPQRVRIHLTPGQIADEENPFLIPRARKRRTSDVNYPPRPRQWINTREDSYQDILTTDRPSRRRTRSGYRKAQS